MKKRYRKPVLKSEKMVFECSAVACVKFGRIGDCINRARIARRGLPARS
jgi:hypothetical protein